MEYAATSLDLRYPVGKFDFDAPVTSADRGAAIDDIAAMPQRLRDAVAGLNDEQLDTPYRPGGWTVRQTVHHLADSHMNSYIRFKLALTENSPTIKPYNESAWATLPEAKSAPIGVSLALIDSLHERLVMVLRAMSESDFARTFQHPERGVVRLDTNVALYGWHSRHHVAHITALRKRMGW